MAKDCTAILSHGNLPDFAAANVRTAGRRHRNAAISITAELLASKTIKLKTARAALESLKVSNDTLAKALASYADKGNWGLLSNLFYELQAYGMLAAVSVAQSDATVHDAGYAVARRIGNGAKYRDQIKQRRTELREAGKMPKPATAPKRKPRVTGENTASA